MRDKYGIKKCIYFIIFLLLAVYIFRIATIFDENYTLVLTNNSFANIIKLDSLDVHPPLFYFLLKIFLNITTFWTKSFLIKVIFSRIFVFIISLITFYFLLKILEIYKLKLNISLQFLAFLIAPGVISLTYELIKLRMYSLSALFIVIQLFLLCKYQISNRKRYIYLITIFTILSLYTNYYSGMISGIIIFVYMLENIFKRNNKWFGLLFSGLFSLIIFSPWLYVIIKQYRLQAYHSIGGFGKQWIATFIVILLFIYPVIWSKRYLSISLFHMLLNVTVITLFLFIIMSLTSLLFKPVFEFRYLYPILIIYEFFGMNIYFIIVKSHINKFGSILAKTVILITSLICIGSYIQQVKYYGSASIQLVKDFRLWKTSSTKLIKLHFINNYDEGFDLEKVIYLSTINKYSNVPINGRSLKYPTNVKNTEVNPSYRKLFFNIDKNVINLK